MRRRGSVLPRQLRSAQRRTAKVGQTRTLPDVAPAEEPFATALLVGLPPVLLPRFPAAPLRRELVALPAELGSLPEPVPPPEVDLAPIDPDEAVDESFRKSNSSSLVTCPGNAVPRGMRMPMCECG